MTTRGEINSNFYQIVNVDANGAPTEVKPQYITGGNVDHANVADVANSVSVGNVVGIGNIATINLTGSSSNVLFGNGVFAGITAGANANYANFAGEAFDVAVGNVSGIGNIAVINLDGNSGNILFGNGVFSAAPNVSSANYANFAGQVVDATQSNITSLGTLTTLTVSGTSSFTANMNLNLYHINNVGYPVGNSDAATKEYVDIMASTGISFHQPVNAATATTLATATGGTTAYNSPNGASNGIGAYISTTGTFALIDTENIAVANSRILVKDEANATWNGIYNYTNATAITRSSDADTYGLNDDLKLGLNDYFFTLGGNVNKGTAFVVNEPPGTITFGTSNIGFTVFSTGLVYTGGTGINVSGTVINISNTTVTSGSYGNGDSVATFTVNGQGQLTAASNTAITANAANLTGTTLNATIVNSSLTNVGTLTSLNVSSAVNATSFTSNVITGTAPFVVTSTTEVANLNVAQANIANTANAVAGANVSGSVAQANLANTANAVAGANVSGQVGNALVAGTVYTNAQPNITSTGSLTGLTVSNATGVVNFTTTANVTLGSVSNLHISGGTVGQVLTTDGTGGLSFTTVTSGGTPGGSNTYAQFNDGGSFGGVANFTFDKVTNTLTATNIAGNGSGLTSLTGANVTGTVPLATSATTAGTVTTASQPNITSTGTLTSLSVSGQLTSTVITGTAPFVVSSTTQVANLSVAQANIANTANAVAGANVSGNVASATVAYTSNITASSTSTTNFFIPLVTGVGNNALYIDGTAGDLSYQPSSGNLTVFRVVGNVTGTLTGAATTAGTVTTAAQPNITSVGSLTGLTVSNATGVVDFTTTANVTLGAIGNLHISGGSSGQYVTTDGAGGLSFTTGSGGVPSQIANGTSNVNIATVNGAVTVAVGGANTVTFNTTSSNFTGNLGMTANTIVTSNAELSFGSTGDTYGAMYMRIQNRVGQGGPLIDGSLGSQGAIVDLGFKVSGPVTRNIRMETRAGANLTGGPEFQFGVAASPGFYVGDSISIANGTTVSTSTTSGSFQVKGGVGVVGNIYVGGNANITGIANVTGNVIAPYFIGNGSQLTGLSAGGISNGTSNISAPILNGNITVSIGGVANTVVFTSTGTNIAGYLTSTANITAPYFIGNGSALTGIAAGAGGSTTEVQYNNAGVLAGMANVTFAAGNLSLGPVANVKLTGGTNGYYLQTDGAGNLAWVAGGGSGSGVVGGSNTQVQFNDAGNFGGVANLTFDKVTNTLTTTNFTAANVSTVKYNETVVAGGSVSGTLTPNAAAGTIYNYTLTGSITLSSLTNAVAGTGMTIILTQGGSGSYTLTSTMKFLGAAKTLSTAVGAIDIMSVFYDGTTYYASLGKGFA